MKLSIPFEETVTASQWCDQVWEDLSEQARFNPYNVDEDWFDDELIRQAERRGVTINGLEDFDTARYFARARDSWTL